MASLPESFGNDQHLDVKVDVLLVEAEHQLAQRKEEVRAARREVRRLRRAYRAELRRRVSGPARTTSRIGLAAMGSVLFVTGLVMFIQGELQAADMLSAALTCWALAVALRRRK
ncbi:hypothetical protein HRW14_24475 [Streptomyces lunaelactis]|uniref:hypothetical protein n=1 Tax=Streptomyces lunaelactis TaxID=1535768 RepID=UPI0015854089|nr:hypothetical protein [Streptomyces lunaelactis]NUK53371.1 hypothetical protein [Streptomyces lunaelactis]